MIARDSRIMDATVLMVHALSGPTSSNSDGEYLAEDASVLDERADVHGRGRVVPLGSLL